MLVIHQTGTVNLVFHYDSFTQNWGAIPRPTYALILGLTNDMTRESLFVTLLPQYNVPASSTDAISTGLDGGNQFLTGVFLSTTDSTKHSPQFSTLYIKDRGYYSYKLYEGRFNNQYPTNAMYNDADGFPANEFFATIDVVDKGKALVLTRDTYNSIISGTSTPDGTVYSIVNDEVSYTSHTDKVKSSDIDTDNNFIHIN